ncbi:Transcription factor [Penicillium occitanis (nom. inval.)]|nr:Transcription factor [Penicillium occitanis (nom. inval.)]PCG90991.1 hypothetical protein PENOC_099470 [Penicillium occitanis (nom. inval.)]
MQTFQTTEPVQDLPASRPTSKDRHITDNGDELAPANPATADLVFENDATGENQDQEDEEGAETQPETAEEQGGDSELAKQHLVEFFSQDLLDSPPISWRLTYAPRVLRESKRVPTPNLIPKDAFVLPPRHVSDVLIAAYFRHVHPWLPIIDRENFLTAYETSGQTPPLLLVQALCLAGSHVQTSFDNTQDLKVAFFRRTKALFDGRYEEDRMHMVQAALLMTWFSDGGDDVCANAWWWIGVASRVAIGLGMHRDVEPSKMPEGDKRTWRRIWWCLVQFDLLVSLCYGRPQNINLDDCDAPPLSIDDFDSSSTSTQAQFLKSFKAQADQNESLRFADDALASWLINLPPELRRSKIRDSTPQIDPSPLLLHLTYHAVLVQLHRLRGPITSNGFRDTIGSVNDQICGDSASNIVQIFDQLSQLSALKQCWFWAPSSLFAAMLQLKLQLQCDNAIIALRAREDYESGLHSLSLLSRHWLLAASVSRLFRSDSIKPGRGRKRPQNEQIRRTGNGTAEIYLESESPSFTVSSAGQPDTTPSNAYTQQLAVEDQNMDWIHLFPFGGEEVQEDYMHFQPNRWQDSLAEWQTLYWSDSVTSLMMPETSNNHPAQ